MKPIVKAPAPKEEAPDDVPEERRIAQGREAVRKAKQSLDRTLARAPSSPSLPAVAEIPPVLDPLPALVATLRRAGVPAVFAALRDYVRGLPGDERETALALLAELLRMRMGPRAAPRG